MKKNKLIDVRERKDITQKKMADILCMDVSNYNRREKGTAKISMNQWQKMAETLEVSLEEIFENDESSVFIINDKGNASNTYYNIPLSMWESQKKYIEKLEAEIEILKSKNGEK